MELTPEILKTIVTELENNPTIYKQLLTNLTESDSLESLITAIRISAYLGDLDAIEQSVLMGIEIGIYYAQNYADKT